MTAIKHGNTRKGYTTGMWMPDDIGSIDWAEEDTGLRPVVRSAPQRAAGRAKVGYKGPAFLTRQRKPFKAKSRAAAGA